MISSKFIENENVIKLSKQFPNIIVLCVIIMALYTCFSIATVDRSLWLDEAMLSFSLSKRPLTDLTSSVLERNQSAPVIYLYIVKIITMIFGNSEVTLRVWSLVSYVLTLFTSYIVLSKVLKLRYSLIGVAFIATSHQLIRYSNEFKPYMNDCWVVLAVVILYYLYDKRKVNIFVLTLCFAILLWFSNPACFFIGGILLYEFYNGVKTKNQKAIKDAIMCGSVVFLSFGVYYFYWIKPVVDIGFMSAFWESCKLPFPLSLEDIAKIKNLLSKTIGTQAQSLNFVYLIGAFLWIYNFFYAKNKYISCIYLGILVMLFASMLGFQPINGRLCLFLLPLLCIFAFFFIHEIYLLNNVRANIVVTVVLIALVLPINGLRYYTEKEGIKLPETDTNSALLFVKNNIASNESLYIHELSFPGYYYKTQLADDKIIIDNPTFTGAEFYTPKQSMQNINKEVETIINNSPTYLLFSHISISDATVPLIEALEKRGNMDVVYDDQGVFIYYFAENKECSFEN